LRQGLGPNLAAAAYFCGPACCTAAAAEAAVRKAKANGAPVAFEPFFRRALELVR